MDNVNNVQKNDERSVQGSSLAFVRRVDSAPALSLVPWRRMVWREKGIVEPSKCEVSGVEEVLILPIILTYLLIDMKTDIFPLEEEKKREKRPR